MKTPPQRASDDIRPAAPSIDDGAFDGYASDDRPPSPQSLARFTDTQVLPREALTDRPPTGERRRLPRAARVSPRDRVAVIPPVGLMRAIVFTLAGIFVLALGGLLAETAHPAWFAGLHLHVSPAQAGRGGTAQHGSTASVQTTSPAKGTSAVISAVRPSAGVSGQTVVVSGTDLMSGSGSIVAHFGPQVAPTRCPTAQRCVVTVPPAPTGSTTVPVRLQIGSGISNSLVFTYR